MQSGLHLQLLKEHYENMIKTCHFRTEDFDMLKKLGDMVDECTVPWMWYEGYEPPEWAYVRERSDGGSVAVVVTLGAGVDELQRGFVENGRLTEGYMIECIGMELLRLAYEQTAEKICADTGKWIAGFDFLGERYPLELMEDVFRAVQPIGVHYNAAYMLEPKKSVVFISKLEDVRRRSFCNVCDTCSNLGCQNRRQEKQAAKEAATVNLTYGYQRIFGRHV